MKKLKVKSFIIDGKAKSQKRKFHYTAFQLCYRHIMKFIIAQALRPYTYTYNRPSIGHIGPHNALKHGPDKKIRGTGSCYRQCGRVRASVRSNARTASPLVSTNPRRLVQGPIPLIFYQVRASTFHHYDRSMYVYGLKGSMKIYVENMKEYVWRNM